jgi:hypothetical protein
VSVSLGDKARDSVTGFQGICVARTQWLNGCVRCTLQGETDKDGKVPDSVTFDEPQLVVLVSRQVKCGPTDTGGPIPNPQQKSGPTR